MSDQNGKNEQSSLLLGLTTDVVTAYIGNNSADMNSLGDIIVLVYKTLANLEAGAHTPAAEVKPAVPIKKSITDDYLVCLEDGKKLIMLKRYLRSQYDLSPEDYRAKWGLPGDYPMVAPNYARRRSAFAKEIGLGRSSGRKKARKAAE